MLDWPDVRAIARAHREGVGSRQGVDAALARAFRDRDIQTRTIVAADGFGSNVQGAMDRSARLVFISPDLSDEEARFVKAHELGHFLLHTDPRLETSSISYASDPGPREGYSAHALVETQADVFAAEFLCPADLLREAFAGHGDTPSTLARRLGLPEELVRRQAVRALLRPPAAAPAEDAGVRLDPEQARAAAWRPGNLIVQGAPGSGKTTVCVGRMAHLLARGESAASIALVCRDGAAARRTRAMAIAADPAAVQVWCGTMRELALEIVGACASRAGRTGGFRVVDDVAALAAMNMASGGHYAGAAKSLREVRRSKKSLGALAAADDGLNSAGSVDGLAARIEGYDRHLEGLDLLDPADLLPCALRALDTPEVAAMVAGRFGHLVVDDFEETCAADHAFLSRLCRLGVGIVAAGDSRASIRRHNGARPEAIAAFEEDFRPAGRIVLPARPFAPAALDAAAARAVGEGGRADGVRRQGRLAMSVAPTVAGEARAIARRIGRLRGEGIPHRDQVVLARSHGLLDLLAKYLTDAGVPVSHLGEIGRRREVRDLLAVLDVVQDAAGADFGRVAGLPFYGLSAKETRAVAKLASARGLSRSSCLASILSGDAPVAASPGLLRLTRDFAGFSASTPPWDVLTTWLFERTDYLGRLCGSPAEAASAREAIRLLLGVCDDQLRQGDTTSAGLRARIARIRALDQDTRYHGDPSDDDGSDRVRLMTIHAAKGRSFQAVHLAGLAEGRLPFVRPAASAGTVGGAAARGLEEERAVFAVAMTRATRHLHLSRSERYYSAAKRSRFVDELGDTVVERPVDDAGLPRRIRRRAVPPLRDRAGSESTVRHLSVGDCQHGSPHLRAGHPATESRTRQRRPNHAKPSRR